MVSLAAKCVEDGAKTSAQLSNEVQQQSTPDTLSEEDLDAEIARYTQMLQQMDVLEMDLQHLDDLATMASIHCRQAEVHTPRASPEIMP
jgi:Tat protein secretion system quality control protein TatD with DNase activity